MRSKVNPLYHWQPTASLENIRERARLYQTLRNFFADRQILEVETPILSNAAVPEPTIAPYPVQCGGNDTLSTQFLHTSPELAMKRLLAAGSGPIYQIAKVFRQGEQGPWHNPEFTLLEWYRPGFTQFNLIQELGELLQTLLHCPPPSLITYCDLFLQHTGLHPLHAPLTALRSQLKNHSIQGLEQLDRDNCLQLIISYQIQPQLGLDTPQVIYNYPLSQAALARPCPEDPNWAQRFEVYYQGVELANGFRELTDEKEQRQRFIQDLQRRRELNLPTYPLDERFLSALEAGLPECSGVAMGLDRVLMLLLQATHIHQVISFPNEFA